MTRTPIFAFDGHRRASLCCCRACRSPSVSRHEPCAGRDGGEQRPERVEQLDVAAIGRRRRPLGSPGRARSGRCVDDHRPPGLVEVAEDARPRRRRASRRRGWRHPSPSRVTTGSAADVGLDLVPQGAPGAAAVGADLVGRAPRRRARSSRLRRSMNATASRIARTKWPFPWREREAVEHAPRLRLVLGAEGAHEVGQHGQPVGPGRHVGRELGQQVVGVPALGGRRERPPRRRTGRGTRSGPSRRSGRPGSTGSGPGAEWT